jgi:hypothetical protein
MFDEKATAHWREVDLPAKVADQVVPRTLTPGQIDEPQTER